MLTYRLHCPLNSPILMGFEFFFSLKVGELGECLRNMTVNVYLKVVLRLIALHFQLNRGNSTIAYCQLLLSSRISSKTYNSNHALVDRALIICPVSWLLTASTYALATSAAGIPPGKSIPIA